MSQVAVENENRPSDTASIGGESIVEKILAAVGIEHRNSHGACRNRWRRHLQRGVIDELDGGVGVVEQHLGSLLKTAAAQTHGYATRCGALSRTDSPQT